MSLMRNDLLRYVLSSLGYWQFLAILEDFWPFCNILWPNLIFFGHLGYLWKILCHLVTFWRNLAWYFLHSFLLFWLLWGIPNNFWPFFDNWNNISAKHVWKCSAGNAITLPIVKRPIMKLYPCIMLMPSNVILAKWSSQVRNFGLFFKNIGHIVCFLSQSGIYVVFLPFGQFFTIFKDFC